MLLVNSVNGVGIYLAILDGNLQDKDYFNKSSDFGSDIDYWCP
jgi:hypothetical protein